MGRAKLPRKSTNIDMTAMCDVAFLLLSFFILATKFKPPEALSVTTPSSVYTKIAAETNVVLITMDRQGRVFFSVSDKNVPEKDEIINTINTQHNLGLTKTEMNNFSHNPTGYVGVPFTQLKALLDRGVAPDALKGVNMPGIPTVDSTNNELRDWIAAAVGAFQGGHMYILIKGDDAASYPAFSGVIWALKKNDQLKFQLITSPIAAPPGSELYNSQIKSGNKLVE
ncbi:MAG TPA: biopolymer transporter ExbD [Puia sp.]|nr:biopolymer transporter ExbD [Puia sp.]